MAKAPAFDEWLAAARVEYAGRLPAKAAELEALAAAAEWTQLRRAAHKLRGSAEVYGFAALGAVAARVEECLLAGEGEPEAAAIAEIEQALSDLSALAGRAAGGPS